MKLATWNLKLNLRRELRLALLAAAETCWVYATVVFLAASIDKSRALTPLPFFFAYWIALIVGRILPQSKNRWIVLQAIAVGVAGITILLVAWLELSLSLSDFTWLPRFVPALIAFTQGIQVVHIITLAVVCVFIRGLGFAQRPLTLWFVGFQFRLGIVVFFLLLLFSNLIRRYDPSLWIFVYFFLALLAVALARTEEMIGDVSYGTKWAITLLAAVALVLFVGLGVLQLFNPDTADTILSLLNPLVAIFGLIVLLAAIPFALIADWLVERLEPYFGDWSQAFNNLTSLLPQSDKTQQQAPTAIIELVRPIAQVILVLAVLVVIGYIIARALNRKMNQIEEEAFIREALGNEELGKRSTPSPKKKRAQRVPHIAAESIRRIYAALVANAAAAGLERRTAETPYEFLPRMEQSWQAEADDLQTITEAYIAVHYAEHDATPEQVSRVKSAWQRVEKIIKRQVS